MIRWLLFRSAPPIGTFRRIISEERNRLHWYFCRRSYMKEAFIPTTVNEKREFKVIKTMPSSRQLLDEVMKSRSPSMTKLLQVFRTAAHEFADILQENGYNRRVFWQSKDLSLRSPQIIRLWPGIGLISHTDCNDQMQFCKLIGEGKFGDAVGVLCNLMTVKIEDRINEKDLIDTIIALGKLRLVEEAERVFEAATRLYNGQGNLPIGLFSAIMYCHGKDGNHREVLKRFMELRKYRLTPNRHIIHTLMESFSLAIEKEILSKSMHESPLVFVRNNEPLHSYLTQQTLDSFKIEPIIDAYRQMLQNKITPTVETFTIILRLAGRLKRTELITLVREEMNKYRIAMDLQAYDVLIFALGQTKQLEEAERTLRDAINLFGHERTVRLLVTYLFSLYKNSPLKAAKSLLDEYKTRNCVIPVTAYSYLIGAAVKNDRISDALEWLEAIKQSGRNPHTITYNQVLSFYLKNDSLREFQELIDEMREGGILLDRYTRTMFYDLLGRTGAIDRLKTEYLIFKEDKRWSPMDATAMIKALVALEQYPLVSEFLQILREHDWSTSGSNEFLSLKRTLIHTFLQLGDWEQAMNCLEGAYKDYFKICESGENIFGVEDRRRPDVTFYNMLLESAVKSPDTAYERMEKVLSVIEERKVQIDSVTLTHMIQGYLVIERFDRLEETWKQLICQDGRIPEPAVAARMDSWSKLGEYESLIEFYGEVVESERICSNRIELVNRYLKACIQASKPTTQLIGYVIEDLRKFNIRADTETVNILLKGIEIDRHGEIVAWMLKEGLKSNAETFNILLGGDRKEALDLTERLLDDMQSAGINPSPEQLLRLIKAHLTDSQDHSHQRAEIHSLSLLSSSTSTDNESILTALFNLWLEYFNRVGRFDRISVLREEMDRRGIKGDLVTEKYWLVLDQQAKN